MKRGRTENLVLQTKSHKINSGDIVNEEDLKEATEAYWDEVQKSDSLDSLMKQYICTHRRHLDKSLLEAELEWAEKIGVLPQKSCEILVLIVGYSLEPLIQSVCAYKPGKIVLLLNERYGKEDGNVFGRHIVETFDYLVDRGLIAQKPEFIHPNNAYSGYVVADTPVRIFQTLVKVLHDEYDVVIDITGGKKSMVTGAFLYAAYAGVPISYVDFDVYDPKVSRPYGYTCKIGELSNPYENFALREWEKVRDLYCRYKFHDAREVLEGNIQNAIKSFLSDAYGAIEKMLAVLRCYEYWNLGDFNKSKDLAQTIDGFEPPSVVTYLGGQWFEINENKFVNLPNHFYEDSHNLRAYIYDELERITRLIEFNEDYRSAFLQSGFLNEVIMLTRLVQLIPSSDDKEILLEALDERTPGAKSVFDALLKPDGSDIVIRKNGKKDINLANLDKKIAITLNIQTTMKKWWKQSETGIFSADDGYVHFIDRRNDLAHKYFRVPKEWSVYALKFVTADFEDFLEAPVNSLGLDASSLPWSDLCELCGIDHFLPPNLRR